MNRPPYRRSDEIAAYTYQADIYCPACLIEAMIADGIAAPAARDMPTDDVLEQCAGALAIDRDDDTTYDTSEFPKPWTDEIIRAADVVVTMGCGDACPLYPGKRYEDWELDDPAGCDVADVRPIRDEIRRRVEALLTSLEVTPVG